MTEQDLQELIAQGEGYYIEFKRDLNSDFKKELVAFANASGGKIILGVEDNGHVRGVQTTNAYRSEIQQHAHECDPSVEISVEEIDNVVVITVPEGKHKPYRSTNGFYLRVGPNSQKMGTDQIAEYVEKFGRIRFDERIRKDLDFDGSVDKELINKFIESAQIKNVFQNKTHILLSLGAVKQVDNANFFTNAGVLFFTQDPTFLIPQAKITCVAYNGTKKVDILDRKDFSVDLITSIEMGLAFIRRHLNEASAIKGLKREDKLEIPLVALREALVNAVAHRDYVETGARIMIEIFSDRITISNPGGLPPGLSANDFGKYSLSRNPIISDLLYRVGLIEKLGTGVNRIKAELKAAHLPEAIFHFSDFFSVTFLREIDHIDQSGLLLTEKQQEIFDIIKVNARITKPELSQKLGINPSVVDKYISVLKKKGFIRRIGTRNGYWEILEVGE